MPIHIDLPSSTIEHTQFSVAGWIASQDDSRSGSITVNGHFIAHDHHERPDVRSALAQFCYTSGISASVNLLALPAADHVEVELTFGHERVNRVLGVSDGVRQRWKEESRLRVAHRQFCLSRLLCPACGTNHEGLEIGQHLIACRRCGTRFGQTTRALNMISRPLALLANIAETALVSANPYTPEALALIERVTGKGGMVLDCGAGSRPARTRNVINLEIVDYASTDLLAVGESLPFADASFDGVVSLAVLEHVRDPFKCARELMRVLKAGGEILVDVPFLQPAHGYPHHYYNMTAQGLRNLFSAGTTEIRHDVPPHGHPIFAVQWILREYCAGLPAGVAEQFASMPVAASISTCRRSASEHARGRDAADDRLRQFTPPTKDLSGRAGIKPSCAPGSCPAPDCRARRRGGTRSVLPRVSP